MGTFEGHVVPGVVFILFGFWHIVQFTRKYFRDGKKRYKSNTYFPEVSCLSNKLPCESVIKIIATVIHFTVEVITGFKSNGLFGNWGNTQHMASLSLFFVQGVVEALKHNKINIPSNVNYVVLVVAFLFEAFVFSQHLHGRSMVDTRMHIALVILALITAMLIALEMRHRKSVTLMLITRYLVILQGTWLFEMGFVLFPPSRLSGSGWSLNDHEYNELLSATLGFQAGLVFFVILAIWLCFAIKNGMLYKTVDENHCAKNGYRLLNDDEEQFICDTR